jgi:hypothetical protein
MSRWGPDLANRARSLLEHLFEVYREETAPSSTPASTPNLSNKTSSMFFAAIQSMTPSQQDAALTELERYFNGSFPCHDGNVLAWWKVSSSVTSNYDYFLKQIYPLETCQ